MKLLLRIAPVLLFCVAALVIMCGENIYNLSEDLTYREVFEMGKKYFLKRDYRRAKVLFDRVARLGIIADFSDSAQFLLAESNYNLRDYLIAENEYERVLPGSMLRPKAMYMIGMCYYKLSFPTALDQKYTNEAIKAFENFYFSAYSQFDQQLSQDALNKLVELHGKLAEKDLNTGILYKKEGSYNSAIIYLDYAMFNYNQYGTVSIVPRALYEMGECYARLKQYSEAEEKYQALIDNFKQHPYAEKAREKLAKIKTEIAKTDTTLFK